MISQHLRSQSRAEIGVVLFDQRDRIIPNARRDPVVRAASACLVADRGSTFSLERLQQPVNLPAAQPQHSGCRDRRHPSINNLAQNLDTIQLALAHQNPSHGHTPILLAQQGRVTLLLCRCGTF